MFVFFFWKKCTILLNRTKIKIELIHCDDNSIPEKTGVLDITIVIII